jgi:hypothetical protein
MKLRKLVLLAIKGSPETRKRIREALKVSNPTITHYLNSNHENLTKAASLEVIREDFGMTDSEILESADALSESQN